MDKDWKKQRKHIKEYKWGVDIIPEKYIDYSCSNVFWYIVGLGLFLMIFVHFLLDALMIKDIFAERTWVKHELVNNPDDISFCIVNSTSSNANSTLLTCSALVNTLEGMGIAYIVFTGVCVAIFLYDAKVSLDVVLSGDVSDSFENVLANSWHGVTNFGRFCFFREVANRKAWLDTFSVVLYQTLYQGKQFIADIPMFIIAYLYSVDIGETTLYYKATAYAKFIFLAIRFVVAIFCLICYPIVRFCFVHGSLRLYASFRVDKIIELVLWPETHGAGSVPPEDGATNSGPQGGAVVALPPSNLDAYPQQPAAVYPAGYPQQQPTDYSTGYPSQTQQTTTMYAGAYPQAQPGYAPGYPPPQAQYQNQYAAGYPPQQNYSSSSSSEYPTYQPGYAPPQDYPPQQPPYPPQDYPPQQPGYPPPGY